MGLPQGGNISFIRPQSAPEPHLKGARVLVVEDEVLLAWEIERQLYAAGCAAVRCVAVAADALHELKYWRPDAAVLDIMMRDGRSSTPVADVLDDLHVPFVFVSAHSRRDLPDRHRERPFLAKPCPASVVVDTLGKLVGVDAPAEGVRHQGP
jgi:CheY-like chemotaxis protein